MKRSQLVRKHPVSIALSNQILQLIDQEAAKQKRSRSEWLEVHFEDFFSSLDKQKLPRI
jgi:metal-responsive CopG/Arc/MetJ family transcriptional regulator